jgi:HAD superfamily hydrolase (TIGR01549 family)
MEKLRPKAVIFDLGSTLIDYPSSVWEELSRECMEAGRRMLVEEKLSVPEGSEFGKMYESVRDDFRKNAAETLVEWTVPQAVSKLLGKLDIPVYDGLVDRFFECYYKVLEDRLYVYDDTVSMLGKIKESIGTVGLISNTIFPEQTHLAEMARFGIDSFFDFKIFSCTFGLRKPHADIFLKAANLAGYAPQECVYIGDRYVEDIEGPNSVGMAAILREHPDREYPDPLPEGLRRIGSLSGISEHIDI